VVKTNIINSLKDKKKRTQYKNDIKSGFLVGLEAIPLIIAFAAASGISAERGMITAIISGIVLSLAGRSKVQIGGPSAMLIVLTFSIIQSLGYTSLLLITVLAGIILIIMSLFKMGNILKYVPYPIVTGITSGMALVIMIWQVGNLALLNINDRSVAAIPRIFTYIESFDELSVISIIIGVIALFVMAGLPYITRKISSALAALIITTAISQLPDMKTITIGQVFNNTELAFPSLFLPEINLSFIPELLPYALVMAILIGTETLMSSAMAVGLINKKHKPDGELLAQGMTNIFAGLLGGMPTSGSVRNTVSNIRNGGRTFLSGIFYALTVSLALIFLLPNIKLIPISTAAAVVLRSAFKMSEWRSFRNLFKSPLTDIILFLSTFFLTVFVNVRTALEVGFILTTIIFMKKMADNTTIESVTEDIISNEIMASNSDPIDPSIQIFQIYGPFFFGAADKFTDTIHENTVRTKALIIIMRHVPFMDETGYHTLFKTYSYCRRHKILLLFTEVCPQPYKLMEKYGFIELIGKDNLCKSLDYALERASAYIELNKKYSGKEKADS
jgi:SulP family sulfate permease